MKQRAQPIAVQARTAANMLDISEKEFLRLVAQGALPPPQVIGVLERWCVAELTAIFSGEARKPEGDGDFE